MQMEVVGNSFNPRGATKSPIPLIDPSTLPASWTMARDANGQPMYINKTTGETSWRPPFRAAEKKTAPKGIAYAPRAAAQPPPPVTSTSARRDAAQAAALEREQEREQLRNEWRERDAQRLADERAKSDAARARSDA